MTEQDAIENFKGENKILSQYAESEFQKVVFARKIERNNMAIHALEKHIPKKPKEYEDKYYACSCGNVLLMKWEKYNTILTQKSKGLPYCLACGQKIDWGEEE